MFTVDAKSTAPSKGTLPEDAGTPIFPEIHAYVRERGSLHECSQPVSSMAIVPRYCW
jgi:hypothetical protein